MVYLNKDWSDDFRTDYWHCYDCNARYVDSNNEFCRNCGSPETWETTLSVGEIKERETRVDGIRMYAIVEDDGVAEERVALPAGLDLTDEMLDRNTDIHDAVYEMLLVLLEKEREEFEWDMEIIGNTLEDIIASLWGNFKMRVRYPSVVTFEDGRQRYDEYSR